MSDPHRLVRTRLDQVSRCALEAAIADEPPVDAKGSVWRAIGLALPTSGVALGATASTRAATTSKSLTAGNAAASGAATTLGKTGVIAGTASGVVTSAPWVLKAVVAGVGIGLALNAAMLVPRWASSVIHQAPATSATGNMSEPARERLAATVVVPPPSAPATTVAQQPAVQHQAPTTEAIQDSLRANEMASGSLAASRVAGPLLPADTLREESQLLVRVRQALNASDASRALHLIGEHRRLFGAGTLTQECDVMEVQALVQLGRSQEAKAHANAFLQRYPASPHGEKMRAIAER